MNYSSVYIKADAEYVEGRRFVGTLAAVADRRRCRRRCKINTRKENEGYGAVRAIDPKTGDRKWEFKMNDVTEPAC